MKHSFFGAKRFAKWTSNSAIVRNSSTRCSRNKTLGFEQLEPRIALSTTGSVGSFLPSDAPYVDPVVVVPDSAPSSLSDGSLAASAVSESLLARRIVTWATLGPFIPSTGDGFDENFLAASYAEANAYAYLGASVNGKTWEYLDDRTISRNQDDYVDFYTYYGLTKGLETSNRVAYAANWIYIPSSGNYKVHFGHNDKAKLWVDGNLIVSEPTAQLAQREDHQVNVTLVQGWRRVLVKVVNVQRTWGFYFSLTHTDNTKISNVEFAPHDPGPGDPLVILTPDLPDGYGTQPYVWLYVTDPLNKFPEDNASASPFRFVGRGGIAPYTYHIHSGSLPVGMALNSTEGELTGTPTNYGLHTFTIRMEDSSGATAATKTFTLDVKPRPTTWLEQGNRMGGLRHGLQKFDNPLQQAELAARQGYDWIAPTDFGWVLNVNRDVVITSDPTVDAWAAALHAQGIEVGVYQGLGDPWYSPSGYPLLTLHEFTEGFHDGLEQWARRLNPKLWWFDGWNSTVAFRRRPPNMPTYEFDALFSLLKALNPEALILVNSAEHDGQVAEVGDVDFVSFEGKNDVGNYWLDWPASNLLVGQTPKYLLFESWRYPDANYQDWREWLRVIITMLAEPANNTAARIVDFDTSWTLNDEFYNLHLNVANWLDPYGGGERRKAIMGTFPYSINEGNWGYDVINPDTGDVYLHFVANPRGKNGVFGSSITVGPVDFTVRQVSLLPNSTPLPFTQVGNMVTINMLGVAADPVSTIVELSPAPPLTGDYNLDNVVDAADYVVWRKALGTSVPRYSSADGDGNTLVDQADHGLWRSHFGTTVPSAATIASGANLFEEFKPVAVTPAPLVVSAKASDTDARAAGFAGLLSEALEKRAAEKSAKSLRTASVNTSANDNDDLLLLAMARSEKRSESDNRARNVVDAKDKLIGNSDPAVLDELLENTLSNWT